MSNAVSSGLRHRARWESVAFQHCNGYILTVIEMLPRGSDLMLRTLLNRGRDWFLVRPGSRRCSGLASLTRRGRMPPYENINAVDRPAPCTFERFCVAVWHASARSR